ncbi:MAG: hypothetical protein R6U32_03780 [Candidatus Woesearchaeota archaeon]
MMYNEAGECGRHMPDYGSAGSLGGSIHDVQALQSMAFPIMKESGDPSQQWTKRGQALERYGMQFGQIDRMLFGLVAYFAGAGEETGRKLKEGVDMLVENDPEAVSERGMEIAELCQQAAATSRPDAFICGIVDAYSSAGHASAAHAGRKGYTNRNGIDSNDRTICGIMGETPGYLM